MEQGHTTNNNRNKKSEDKFLWFRFLSILNILSSSLVGSYNKGRDLLCEVASVLFYMDPNSR